MKKIALVCALATATVAPHAYAGIPMFYGTAETSVKVHDLPDEFPFLVGAEQVPMDVGYCYKQLQILFVPAWNYNEHYCGYIDDKRYSDISKENLLELSKALSLDTSWDNDEPKIPFWDRIGGKLVLGAVVLFAIYRGIRNKREEAEEDD